MKITATETFEQKYKNPSQIGQPFGKVEYLKFNKGGVYQFFIVPKVVDINLEKDEAKIEYPFEEIITHFGTYKFMREFARMNSERINCKGCAIEDWMAENRLPKSVFKVAVGTKFFLTYVIHEKKIKVAWFQDYLYGIFLEKISQLMAEKEINLIDAFRHRIKLYTDSSGKFDIAIDKDAIIPTDSEGFKKILKAVHEKPLESFVEQQVTTDFETIDAVLHALKDYTEKVVKDEQDRAKREKMEEKTQYFKDVVDAFKEAGNEKKTNGIITDEPLSVGPESIDDSAEPSVDDENPF
jgi:hypothetical protein